MIDTKNVRGRRRLRFSSYDDVLVEVRRLAQGPTRSLGNWSLGQTCKHLALAMEKCTTPGLPFRVGLKTRILARVFRNRMLNGHLPSGFQLPEDAMRVLVPAEADIGESIAALEQAIARMHETSARYPHPAFGAMTPAQWDLFHLRHAEMHLSFIEPQ